MKQFPGRYPILHISAHGGPDGIQLSSGDVITWAMLREFLVPINESLQGILLLCMSACEGYSASRMAMYVENKPYPYYVMIGNYGRPTWSDTAVAYLAFYHQPFKGVPIRDAVDAMRSASGDSGWAVEMADEIKRGYVELVESKRPSDEVQKDLEAVADLEGLPPDAKALEQSSGG
jgi:hypothetical protein